MITRRQYCLSVAMITRRHYCISVEMVTGWIHWIVNVSNCKELCTARRKHKHLQTAGKDHSLGKLDEVPEKDGQKEREGGRVQWFMKKEDKSLRDVEHVETTGERC